MPETFTRRSILLLAAIALQSLAATPLFAQDDPFRPVRTDSPRDTFETLLYVAGEFDQIALDRGLDAASDTRAMYDRTLLLGDQARSLLDLSSVPAGARDEIGWATAIYLIDIFGRVELPEPESIPGVNQAEMPQAWRVPGTPIRIVRMGDGPRAGEYLFDAQTIRDAPRFYRGIEHLPLRSEAGVESWTQKLRQLTGPTIPSSVVQAMPGGLKRLWLDTPIWKALTVVLLVLVAVLAITALHRYVATGESKRHAKTMIRRALTPVAILITVTAIEPLVSHELNVAGKFWAIFAAASTAIKYVAATWLYWLAVQVLFERLSRFRSLDREDFNAQLILVSGQTIGFVGGVVIIGAGAQALGLPVYSIVAGLGIGGLAVALAIRPTLENLIGGVILYLDHPVRVGDFCTFGDKTGTVESIGIRTTKVRALNRTLITIPNANFANMELVNWAHCDKMLIKATIGLRYETEPDQLRHVLAGMREMLHAHPQIDSDTVRVRFAGYGPASLDISVRIYALTRDWNTFFAIREDVYLRINDIVTESGTNFAIPSQTLYITRDGGLDDERGAAAIREVESLRRSGKLPFPSLSAERMRELEGTLDWPPQGSVDLTGAEPESVEPLSIDPNEDPGEREGKP